MELCEFGNSIFNDSCAEESSHFKAHCVKKAVQQSDIERLRMLAETSDGLMNSELRSNSWPVLLCLREFQEERGAIPVARHRDEDQVKLDIQRSFSSISGESLEDVVLLRTRLENIILRVLRNYPELNYYQGYHDIASLVILVFQDDEKAFQFLSTLSLVHLRDFMLPTMDATVLHMELVTDLLNAIDPTFGKVIQMCKNPFYVLPPILTIFSHNIRDRRVLCLIWDFVLTKDSLLFCIYLSVTLILHFKDSITSELKRNMSSKAGNGMEQVDSSDSLHCILSDVVCERINTIDDASTIFNILRKTTAYLECYPISDFPRYRDMVSRFSVLKTTKLTRKATECRDLFQRQMLESLAQVRQKNEPESGANSHLGLLRPRKILASSLLFTGTTWKRVGINLAVGIMSIFVGKYFFFKDEPWKDCFPFNVLELNQLNTVVFPFRFVKGILSRGL